MPMNWRNIIRNRYLIRIVIDFICLCFVGIPIIIFFAIGKPFKRGFYCDDDSIRYPYRDSTISNKVLYCVGVLFPAAVICGTEILIFYIGNNQKRNFRKVIWEIYRIVWIFGFGACVSQLITDIAKYSIGRLRPHFLAVCQPDVNVAICSNMHQYITNFRCTGPDAFRIREARLSFMSGHSSFSAYCMVFIAMYLQARITWKHSKLLRPFLQTVVLLAAFYTALSRISDYKHHWSDVLAGSIQGIIVAILVVLYVSDLFSPSRDKIKEEIDKSSDYKEETEKSCV